MRYAIVLWRALLMTPLVVLGSWCSHSSSAAAAVDCTGPTTVLAYSFGQPVDQRIVDIYKRGLVRIVGSRSLDGVILGLNLVGAKGQYEMIGEWCVRRIPTDDELKADRDSYVDSKKSPQEKLIDGIVGNKPLESRLKTEILTKQREFLRRERDARAAIVAKMSSLAAMEATQERGMDVLQSLTAVIDEKCATAKCDILMFSDLIDDRSKNVLLADAGDPKKLGLVHAQYVKRSRPGSGARRVEKLAVWGFGGASAALDTAKRRKLAEFWEQAVADLFSSKMVLKLEFD